MNDREAGPCFDTDLSALQQLDLHKKSSEVCIKTRSPLASLPFRDQVTEQTTVKWSINKPVDSNTKYKFLNTNALNKSNYVSIRLTRIWTNGQFLIFMLNLNLNITRTLIFS